MAVRGILQLVLSKMPCNSYSVDFFWYMTLLHLSVTEMLVSASMSLLESSENSANPQSFTSIQFMASLNLIYDNNIVQLLLQGAALV